MIAGDLKKIPAMGLLLHLHHILSAVEVELI